MAKEYLVPVFYLICNESCAYTSAYNLTGKPVVVVPLARWQADLPIGVHVLA